MSRIRSHYKIEIYIKFSITADNLIDDKDIDTCEKIRKAKKSVIEMVI